MSLFTKSILMICTIILAGCQQQVASPKKPDDLTQVKQAPEKLKTETKTVSQPLAYQGTIQYFDLEGGFYGIITKQGDKLLPMNLDKQHQQNGAIIEFSGHNKDMMTIQQWGKPFVIEDIKIIKPGNKALKSEI